MKKILILVMSHETDDLVFKTYKETWDKIYNSINGKYNIDIKFLYSNPNIDNEYIILGDNLIIKCSENYWDALLKKVISGFKFFYENDYDLVFKTNLSTIINFEKFNEHCNSVDVNEVVYEGAIGEYQDYKFCSGAGMLLNKHSVSIILNNLDKINSTWTDDIFFGYILNKLNGVIPKYNGLNRYNIISDVDDISEVKNHTHIRIKIREGNKDVIYTNKVYDLIYGN